MTAGSATRWVMSHHIATAIWSAPVAYAEVRSVASSHRTPGVSIRVVTAIAALTLALTACGGTVAAKDIPPAGQVWFGQTFDPQTFAISGRRTTVGPNEPFAMVAHLSKSVDGKELAIRVSYNGALVSNTSANATGSGDVWGFSSGPLFAAGEWRYDLTDIGGNVLAVGTITAQ